MKRLTLLLCLLSISGLLIGCRGLVSEMQKSEMRAAASTTNVAGQQLQLTAELIKHTNSVNRAFDLVGTIKVIAANGNFPKDASIHRFALKPSWKGWPGYYLINFTDYGGNWSEVRAYDIVDTNFFANSKIENGQFVIDFTWKNQGVSLGDKPKHFAGYDIAVTVTGPGDKRYLLSLLDIPAKPE